MTKKRRRNLTRKPGVPAPSAPGAPGGAVPAAPEQPARPTGFSPDYTYVFQDLRRIGFLAGTFIVLLIVGSLFVR